MIAFPYIYFWNRCGRKGQRCNVTARGKMNSCRVEFEDGFKMITSRNAIRRADRMTGPLPMHAAAIEAPCADDVNPKGAE